MTDQEKKKLAQNQWNNTQCETLTAGIDPKNEIICRAST